MVGTRLECKESVSARDNSDSVLTAQTRRTPHDITKVFNLLGALENLVQSRDLNEPSQVVRKQFMLHDPFGELVPLVDVSSVDAQPPLDVLNRPEDVSDNQSFPDRQWDQSYLVLALLRIGDNLLGQLGQIPTAEVIISL